MRPAVLIAQRNWPCTHCGVPNWPWARKLLNSWSRREWVVARRADLLCGVNEVVGDQDGGFRSQVMQRYRSAYPCARGSIGSMTSLDELQGRLRAFAEARDWKQFHSPKNLAMALAGEVGELSALLQWVEPGDMGAWLANPRNGQALRSELADILAYLLLLADVTDVDLIDVGLEKVELNEQRYPVDRFHGRAAKYSDS